MGHMTDEEVARHILKMAKKQKDREPFRVLCDFANQSLWFQPWRFHAVMREIGRIGGEASRKRAASHARWKRLQLEKAKQGRLL